MKLMFKYRTVVILMLFFINSMNGYSVVYNGDQSASPFIRFLKSLFMGESSTPTPITINGGQAGQLYHYEQFNKSTGIVTTHHPIVTNGGGSGSSPMWNFTPSSGSSMSGGSTSAPSPHSSAGLSFQFASNAAIGGGGSMSASGGGGSGGGSSAGGGVNSAGGFAMFAVGFPQSNLVTAVNPNQTNQTSPPQGTYDSNGWLPDPGEPMPIGDGTWPMLLFALSYAAIIYRKTKREKKHSAKL
jgi:hypothetical protein